MFYRIAKLGTGRMPRLGSDVVDTAGVQLIHDWIASLPSNGASSRIIADERTALDTILQDPSRVDPRLFESLIATSSGALQLMLAIDDGRIAGDWSTPCDANWVGARIARFTPILRDFLSRPDAWRRWSLLTLSKQPKLAMGRLALLGDAAHPVLPFLAQGGVMALEDAVVIAHAMSASAEDPARAFASYAKARGSRVRRVPAPGPAPTPTG